MELRSADTRIIISALITRSGIRTNTPIAASQQLVVQLPTAQSIYDYRLFVDWRSYPAYAFK